MRYQVVEKFISINGEGQEAGTLAIFIRFAGCNLKCSYCDTMWANEANVPFEWMTGKEIYQYIKAQNIFHVTLTGGEPLLQEGIKELLESLSVDTELRIEIETNGSVDLAPYADLPVVFTMDYKLASSQMEEKMLMENFSYLKEKDTVKFVVGNIADMERAKKIVEGFSLLKRCQVHFSPLFGGIEMTEIVSFLIEHRLNGVKFQPQLHKFIWDPNARGV